MTKPESSEPTNAPTPERATKGQIERSDRPIEFDQGDYESPYIVIDLLEQMLKRGAISKEEKKAGERFRAWFYLARLEGLRAADMSRPYVDGVTITGCAIENSVLAETARNEIYRAIRWLGGSYMTSAQCLWHVIGLDESLRGWARKRSRTTSHHNASGILQVALERLARMPWRGPGEKSA